MNRHLDSLTPTLVLVAGAVINHVCKENKELTMRDVMLILSPTVPTLVPILVSVLKSAIAAAAEMAAAKKEAAAAAVVGKEGGEASVTKIAAAATTPPPPGMIDYLWRAMLAVWQHVRKGLGWRSDDGHDNAAMLKEMGNAITEECSGNGNWVATRQVQHVDCTAEFVKTLAVYLYTHENKMCFFNSNQDEQRYKIKNATDLNYAQLLSNIRIQIPLVNSLVDVAPPATDATTNKEEEKDALVVDTTVAKPKMVEIELCPLITELYVKENGVPQLLSAERWIEKKREIDLTKITRLSDFIDDEEERKRFQALITPGHETIYAKFFDTKIKDAEADPEHKGPWDLMVVYLIKEKCPNLDIVKSLLDGIIMVHATFIFGIDITGEPEKPGRFCECRLRWFRGTNEHHLNMFGHMLELDKKKYDYIWKCDTSESSSGKAISGTGGHSESLVTADPTQFPTVVTMLKQLNTRTKLGSDSTPPTPTTLTFTLPTPAICPLIRTSFRKFLMSIQHGTSNKKKTLLGDASSITAKIKIYNMAIERKEVRTELPNPAHAAYVERRDQLAKMDKNEQTQFLMTEFLNQYNPPPPEKIVEIKLEPEVGVQLVNEKSKRFDTLYLRELDARKLHNVLNRFQSGTELCETYGLPNKLGILLHGEPGTGKTSAIQAIATFLQKNIYYTNLSNVETNAELQMLFDHVQLCSSGGGIIVFEDIDAMTTVVHRRMPASVATAYASSSSSSDSLFASGTSTPETQISKWSAGGSSSSGNSNANAAASASSLLTLEYLLNLLQGSLTRDGTIFIATTNYKEKLDPALYREGRFDVDIEMKKCDHFQIQTIYKTFLQRTIPPALLRRIPEDKYTPAKFIYQCVQFIKMDDVSDETILAQFLEE